jgi:hypothetical protein
MISLYGVVLEFTRGPNSTYLGDSSITLDGSSIGSAPQLVEVARASDLLWAVSQRTMSLLYLDCPTGSYRNFSSSKCSRCANGTVSPLGDSQSCLSCPPATDNDAAHAYCLCAAGYWNGLPSNASSNSSSAAACSPCPAGGLCPGQNQLKPQPGWWLSNASLRLYSCPLPAGCLPEGCAAGYGGPLCAVCDAGRAVVNASCVGRRRILGGIWVPG